MASDARFQSLRTAKRDGDCKALIQFLTDPDHRRTAARYLADLECTTATPEIERLLDASDPRVRRAASRALGKLRAKSATARLIEVANTDDDRATREWALMALAEMHDPVILPILLQMLADPARNTRRAAARCLQRLGRPEALPDLRAALARERPLNRAYLKAAIADLEARVSN